jgi:hypothetical protein
MNGLPHVFSIKNAGIRRFYCALSQNQKKREGLPAWIAVRFFYGTFGTIYATGWRSGFLRFCSEKRFPAPQVDGEDDVVLFDRARLQAG